MKKFTSYLITFGIAVLAIVLYPIIRPYAQKIPVIGSYL